MIASLLTGPIKLGSGSNEPESPGTAEMVTDEHTPGKENNILSGQGVESLRLNSPVCPDSPISSRVSSVQTIRTLLIVA